MIGASGTTTHLVVGLAQARAQWPADVARWATSGAAPIDFLACLSADELRATVTTGAPPRAVLLDARNPRVDRDLVAAMLDAGAQPIGVDAPGPPIDWDALGCVAVLPPDFDTEALTDVLRRHCRAAERVPAATRLDAVEHRQRAPMVGVCGPGGTGASTVAMALTQGVARQNPAGDRSTGQHGQPPVLVDGARRAELAMYHDAGDVVPGLPELVERSRRISQDPAELVALTTAVPTRGYVLLRGLRHPRDWVNHRRLAVGAALDVLARAHRFVVVDHDGDLDGGSANGSLGIEDRHAVSLQLARRCDAWVVVVAPGMKGLHAAARAINEAVDAEVPADRIIVVVNRAPRAPRLRATTARTVASLVDSDRRRTRVVFLPDIRRLDDTHRDAARMPAALVDPVSAAVRVVLDSTELRMPPRDTGPRQAGAARIELAGAHAGTNPGAPR